MKRLGALFDTLWLPVFLLLAVSWLFAPMLHHVRYGDLAVISHYEAIDQAWGWLFRLCDLLAAVILAVAIWRFGVIRQYRPLGTLLYAVAALAAVDALFPIGCVGACSPTETLSHAIHDGESAIGAVATFALTIVALRYRRHWFSVFFLCAQLALGLSAASGFVSHSALIAMQFAYETLVIAWLGWLLAQFAPDALPLSRDVQKLVRRAFGMLTLAAGMFALVVAIPHRHLWGPVLDLAGKPNEIWLPGHGIATGVLLLYISRHVAKGQRRAAGLLAIIFATQIFRYSLLQPHFGLLAASVLLLVLLIWVRGAFTRNTMGTLPLASRLQDLGVVLAGVLVALGVVVLVSLGLGKQQVLYRSVSRAYRHDTTLFERGESKLPERRERQLGSAFNALGISIVAVALWSLFRPSAKRPSSSADDKRLAAELLARHANSSEDFFKLWPEDKQYFFNRRRTGFVAYKVAGRIAYAAADPIAPASVRQHTLNEFMDFCHAHGWSVCFLLVRASSKRLYAHKNRNLRMLKIGSSAVIDVNQFVDTTQHEKWWRWQYNRGQRAGFTYQAAMPPHASGFIAEMREVSDAWLLRDGHTERGFMLGYFDESYLQRCTLHLLRDGDGKLVAFANELPVYGTVLQRTVDLIRFLPGVDGAMPMLILHLLRRMRDEGVPAFDLGFVPLAGLDSALASAAKRLGKGRFSAAGLEQFKGKFRPDWQASYVAYDGDLVDLALVLASLENVFKLPS